MHVLSTRGISSEIENIIKYAQQEITLVSPYLKIEEKLFQRLILKAEKGIQITIVYGKKELKQEQLAQLENIPNAHIYFNEHLHAKVYFNEKSAVISSLNLYEFSEYNNFELGVFFTSEHEEDSQAFSDILDEVDLIIASSELRSGPTICDITTMLEGVIFSQKAFEFENYPKKNMCLNNKWGIATYSIDDKKYDLNELKEGKQKLFTDELKGYRFYWNSNNLSLYAAKNLKQSEQEKLDYSLNGIRILNALIKEHIQ